MIDEDQDLELRSFGRRKGRKASPRQAALLRDVLPRVAVDLSAPCRQRDPTFLEIGFGGAEHLVWQAKHNPSVTLIGCEPFEDGVTKALDAIERARSTTSASTWATPATCCAGCPKRPSTARSCCSPIHGRSANIKSAGS